MKKAPPARRPTPRAATAVRPAPAWVRPTYIGLAAALLALVVYANALRNELVWDDPIVLTRQLQAFQSIGDVFFPPAGIPQFSPDYYRPLTTSSYLIDRALGGSGPLMFHLSVVLYHVLCTYLVFQLGLVLWRGTEMALIASGVGALLFAVHPIHSESVAWGAGRSDVLACLFGLAGTHAFLHERWAMQTRSAVAALLLFAGLLAKETVAPLLLLVPATPLVLGSVGNRRRPAAAAGAAATWIPFAAALLLYFGLRATALGAVFGRTPAPVRGSLATLVGALGLYGSKLVLPVWQSAYISEVPTSIGALAAIVIAVIGTAAIALIAWRAGERTVVWLMLWTGLMLAPSLGIVLKIPSAPVAERYLYVPSVGFCLLVGWGAARLWATRTAPWQRTAIGTAVAVAIVAAAAATVQRNAVWRNNLSLWSDTAAKNTIDGLPVRSLATAYFKLGDTGRAAALFQTALQRRNDAAGLRVIHNNLGTLAMHEKRLDDAERWYRAALATDPQSPEALFNLGLVELTRANERRGTGDVASAQVYAQQARQHLESALRGDPRDADTHIALGQTLDLLGERAAARAQFERALQLGLPAETAASVRRLLTSRAVD